MPRRVNPYKQISERTERIARRLLVFVITILVLSILSFWLRMSFWFELFTTFSAQISLFSFALIMLSGGVLLHKALNESWEQLITKRTPIGVMLLGASALLLTNFLLSWHLPQRAITIESSEAATIEVMTFNKLFDNADYQPIINYVSSQRPDILAVQEIFRDEASTLAAKLGYTHWHVASCACSAYGSDLAIFARFPLSELDMAFEDRLGGVLRGVVEIDINTKLSVFNVHIVPPYTSSEYALRPAMLDKLAEFVNSEENPVVVAGDFNMSVHAPDMRELASSISTKARIVAEQPWPQCTWFGASELFCAKIDHVFIPPNSRVVDSIVGPHLGSDHRPLDVEFTLN